jgi:hypothetical protein
VTVHLQDDQFKVRCRQRLEAAIEANILALVAVIEETARELLLSIETEFASVYKMTEGIPHICHTFDYQEECCINCRSEVIVVVEQGLPSPRRDRSRRTIRKEQQARRRLWSRLSFQSSQ